MVNTAVTHPMQLDLHQVTVLNPQGTAPLIQDISTQLPGGSFVGLIGASGSGKTSLLRSLNRLVDPHKGHIHLNGQDLRQLPVLTLRRQIMLVPQEAKLLGMTVQEALQYPLTLQHLPPATIQQRVQQGLEQWQIPTLWLNRTEVQLSQGQRQRVAIARALITAPPILLLDEPTSALDWGQAIAVVEHLQTLAQRGTLVIMANHQLDLVARSCDRLLWLQQGRLVQDVPTATVDWEQVKQDIIAANTTIAAEWGDEDEVIPAPGLLE